MVIKRLFKWVGVLVLIWLVVEVIYQSRVHAVYVKQGRYEWEKYAFERNLKRFTILKNYFFNSSYGKFIYCEHPAQGSMDYLPDSIKQTIHEINIDLTWGLNILKTRKRFEFVYLRNYDGAKRIVIEAGANFRASYNGYNFSLIITEAENGPDKYRVYENLNNSYFYLDEETNQEYRSGSYILPYNANSYDLLILKLLRQ